MQAAVRLLAGDCRVRGPETERRGAVVVLVKPDDTVVVHDADGRRPVAALTADTVAVSHDTAGFEVLAHGDRSLRVTGDGRYDHAHYPVSPAGRPVGACPDCGQTVVAGGGRLTCVGCLLAHPVPDGAAVTDRTCERCGLPLVETDDGPRCPDDGCPRP